MNELIKVEGRVIDGESIQTINARELHVFLESKQEFAHWIKARIEQYGFVSDVDFTVDKIITQYNQIDRIDYYISIDMAKELSMVERNEKGKQARQYFIECERRVKAPQAQDVHTILNSPASLRKLLAGYVDQVIEQQAVIEKQEGIIQEQTPKAEFFDAVADASNCQTVSEVAKELNFGPKKLFKFLKDQAILMEDTLPYQNYIDSGYFRVILKKHKRGDETYTYHQTLVTGKGVAFIQKRLAKNGIPV